MSVATLEDRKQPWDLPLDVFLYLKDIGTNTYWATVMHQLCAGYSIYKPDLIHVSLQPCEQGWEQDPIILISLIRKLWYKEMV